MLLLMSSRVVVDIKCNIMLPGTRRIPSSLAVGDESLETSLLVWGSEPIARVETERIVQEPCVSESWYVRHIGVGHAGVVHVVLHYAKSDRCTIAENKIIDGII